MKGHHGLLFLCSPGDKTSSSSSRVRVGYTDGTPPPPPVLVPSPLSLTVKQTWLIPDLHHCGDSGGTSECSKSSLEASWYLC